MPHYMMRRRPPARRSRRAAATGGGDTSPTTTWTLFSKFSDPHPDLVGGDYPGTDPGSFTLIGTVASGNHPTEGFAINGWTVYEAMASAQPGPDSNTHEWVAGPATDYAPPIVVV